VASQGEQPLFREEQRFTQAWVWILVGVAAIAAWALVGADLFDSDSDDPVWALFVVVAAIGLAVPVLLLLTRLTVAVFDDRIDVRYRPFIARVIELDSVVGAEAVTYRPIREYGGWGLKGWSRRKVAYNVRGDRGVLLTLADGRTVLLGSQRADDLAAAVTSAQRARGSGGSERRPRE
jgi:hypothetical protein